MVRDEEYKTKNVLRPPNGVDELNGTQHQPTTYNTICKQTGVGGKRGKKRQRTRELVRELVSEVSSLKTTIVELKTTVVELKKFCARAMNVEAVTHLTFSNISDHREIDDNVRAAEDDHIDAQVEENDHSEKSEQGENHTKGISIPCSLTPISRCHRRPCYGWIESDDEEMGLNDIMSFPVQTPIVKSGRSASQGGT